MFNSIFTLETAIVITIIALGGCWWYLHGQRDRALNFVRQHCKKLNLTLLDDYVALKRIAFKRYANGQQRLVHIYNFEFTVTQTQRYTGTITLVGRYLDSIDLPPYQADLPTIEEANSIIETDNNRLT